MTHTPRLDLLGDAMAHPSRARILCELMDGRAFTNKELAASAGITPQTASAHLSRLEHAGLISVLRAGRHSYHRISGEPVARALEALSALSPAPPASTAPAGLQHARSCYNHFAGRLAVRVTGALVARGLLRAEDGRFVTAPSPLWAELGVTLPARPGKTAFARPCLDWSERRHHIAGPMGVQMLTHAMARGWLIRASRGDRALTLTARGQAAWSTLLDLKDG